jgi:hypothetical protein
LKTSRFAWLRNAPSSPKADHVSKLTERLRFVREIGLSADAATRVHDNRFQALIREGRISEALRSGAMRRTGGGRFWPPTSSTAKPA